MADNLKAVQDYAESIKALKKREVVIGLPEGKADGSIMDYAMVHEYGSPEKNIPRRSFLRSPTLNAEKKITQFIFNQAKTDSGRINVDMFYASVGEFVKGIIIKSFRSKGDGEWPDIKDSTKKRKGSSGILIDKGQLFQSITYEVRNVT